MDVLTLDIGLSELLTAAAPLPRVRARTKDPASLFGREIFVPNIKSKIPYVLEYAETSRINGLLIRDIRVERRGASLFAEAELFGGELTYKIVTPSFMSGDWEPLPMVPGVEIRVNQWMPQVRYVDGAAELEWKEPVEYRVARRWLRWATTVGMTKLIVTRESGVVELSGLPGRLIEPRLVWGGESVLPECPLVAYLGLVGGADSRRRRRRATEVPDDVDAEFYSYIKSCRSRGVSPSLEGAFADIHRQMTQSAGLEVGFFGAGLFWFGVRSVVWNLLLVAWRKWRESNTGANDESESDE